MSLTGIVHVFTEHRPVNLANVFSRLAGWAESDRLLYVAQGMPILESTPFVEGDSLEFQTTDILCKSCSLSQAWTFYEEGVVLFAAFEPSRRLEEVTDAIEFGIDAVVRGRFTLSQMIVRVGKYRIIRDVEEPRGVVAAPFLDICFFGYGIPEQWSQMRAELRALSVLIKVQRDLTAIVGEEMNVAAEWSC